MPKTYNNIFSSVADFENIYFAYKKSINCKRYSRQALRFGEKLEGNLIDIQRRLSEKRWAPGQFRTFNVYEPKKRLVEAPAFGDRIVHHALVNIMGPFFEKKFIYDSYACRAEKGTHKAMMRVFKFTQIMHHKFGNFYVLKGDIHHYFQSIDHSILKLLVRRSIRDKSVLKLLDKIIDDRGTNGVGLPIGAMTSQLFANIYLNKFDHFIKDTTGIKYYVRYMDDFVILSHDKAYLKALLYQIKLFLWQELHLRTNSKTQIFQYHQGIDFCGYRIWPTHILPRKRTVKRAKKRFKKFSKLYADNAIKLEKIKASLMSFLGYIKHCNGHKTTISALKKLSLNKV